MFVKSKVWSLLKGLVLIAALAGCTAAPTAAPTPTPIPTIDPRPTFNAIATQAVQTMVVDLTLNAPTATPIPPTFTPTVTLTPAPSETPGPTVTETRVFIPWTKTPTEVPPEYTCIITAVSPQPSDTITVDQEFDAAWSIKNSGKKAWLKDNSDVKFLDGTQLQTSGNMVDLKSDVAPNGTTTVVIDMKAPSGDGTYTTTWGLYMNEDAVCNLSLTINVTK